MAWRGARGTCSQGGAVPGGGKARPAEASLRDRPRGACRPPRAVGPACVVERYRHGSCCVPKGHRRAPRRAALPAAHRRATRRRTQRPARRTTNEERRTTSPAPARPTRTQAPPQDTPLPCRGARGTAKHCRVPERKPPRPARRERARSGAAATRCLCRDDALALCATVDASHTHERPRADDTAVASGRRRRPARRRDRHSVPLRRRVQDGARATPNTRGARGRPHGTARRRGRSWMRALGRPDRSVRQKEWPDRRVHPNAWGRLGDACASKKKVSTCGRRGSQGPPWRIDGRQEH